jgi:hypothetical protein
VVAGSAALSTRPMPMPATSASRTRVESDTR